MKQFIILATAVVFFVISGCQKKTGTPEGRTGAPGGSNDVIAELIKEDILSNTGTDGSAGDTNTALMESLSGKPVALATEIQPKTNEQALPEEPMIGTEKKLPDSDKTIRDQAIAVPEKSVPASAPQKGTYLKIGNDRTGQVVTRRKPTKLTTVVFKPAAGAKYLDFWIYATPLGKKTSILLTHVQNIEIVNGQAQFTRYWNGKNISGKYIASGKYQITVRFAVKDSRKKVIRQEYRKWGQDQKYYLRLM